MTEHQAQQICDLRVRGIGYRAIASAVGLSRDIVRNYCKSHGLEGFAATLSMNVRERIERGLACQQCGREIQQPVTGRKRKFCSDECRRKWWAAHQAEINRKESAYYNLTCAFCGKPFASYGNKNRKYCCHECYVRDRFRREKDDREPYIDSAQRKEARI